MSDMIPAPRANAWSDLIAPLMAMCVVGMGMGLTIPLLAEILEMRGYSASIIGVHAAVQGVAVIVISPYVPALSVHVGIRWLLLLALLLASSSLGGFYLTDSLIAWLILRFIHGIAIGILFIVAEYWINSAIGSYRRGFFVGLYNSLLAVGFMFGPLILIQTGIDNAGPFLVGILVFILAGVPLLLPGHTPTVAVVAPPSALVPMLKKSPSAMFGGLIFGMIEVGALGLLVVYALNLSLSHEQANMLLAMVALGNVIFQIPVGYLGDIFDRRLLIIIYALIGMIGIVALPFLMDQLLLLYLLCAIWGGVIVGIYTAALTHIGACFTGADLAVATSALVMMHAVGAVVGPVIIGVGQDLWNPHGYVVAIAILFFFCTIFVGRRWLQHPSVMLRND